MIFVHLDGEASQYEFSFHIHHSSKVFTKKHRNKEKINKKQESKYKSSSSLILSVDLVHVWNLYPPGRGYFHINLYGTCPFSRYHFFGINSWTGYENPSDILKQVMTICSGTIGYCFQEQYIIVFPIAFGKFYNLIILKQGIEIQIFS